MTSNDQRYVFQLCLWPWLIGFFRATNFFERFLEDAMTIRLNIRNDTKFGKWNLKNIQIETLTYSYLDLLPYFYATVLTLKHTFKTFFNCSISNFNAVIAKLVCNGLMDKLMYFFYRYAFKIFKVTGTNPHLHITILIAWYIYELVFFSLY